MKVFFANLRVEKFYDMAVEEIGPAVYRGVILLSERGYNLRMPFSRTLGDRLFELRIAAAVQVRFIYTFKDRNIYILHGFIKKTNEIPGKELEYAKKQSQLL